MEVYHQVVLGGCLGYILVELHDKLVIAVHEIDLEALDTHFRIVLEHTLDVLINGLIASPEDESHILGFSVGEEFLEVYLRHDLEEVRLLVDSPALVEDDVLDAVLGGEIDVVFVSLVIDSGLEINTVDVPVVPPVPSHLSGLDPAPIGVLVGRGAEQPGQVRVHEVLLLFEYSHNPPGETPAGLGGGDVVVTALHNALKHVVAADLCLVGNSGVDPVKGFSAFTVEVEARIVTQVRLGDHHLDPVKSVNHKRKERQPLCVPC